MLSNASLILWKRSLLRDHQQRFLVVEVVGARDDVERGRVAVGKSHVADPLRNVGFAADGVVAHDLGEERGGGAMGLACRTPALVAHHDDRCARLRVEVDDEDFLASPHGQAVGQHHRYGGLAYAAPAIGDGDELGHRGLPQGKRPDHGPLCDRSLLAPDIKLLRIMAKSRPFHCGLATMPLPSKAGRRVGAPQRFGAIWRNGRCQGSADGQSRDQRP